MVEIAILNSMASCDFSESLDIQRSWGIRMLDLKDHIFGKPVAELTLEEAERAAGMIVEREQSVYCLSTGIFHDDLHQSEEAFRKKHLSAVEHVVHLAGILKPECVRLLPCRLGNRESIPDAISYIRRHSPWLFDVYREAAEKLYDAGFPAVIENEYDSIFSNVDEILEFFHILDIAGKVSLTFDVQNLWQMGTYPSLEVYRRLKPIMTYYHVKGGMQEPGSDRLKWNSSLEDASWPVAEITRQVIRDAASPVICLNPSHGGKKPDYSYDGIFRRDVDFMKRLLASC